MVSEDTKCIHPLWKLPKALVLGGFGESLRASRAKKGLMADHF